MVEETEPAQDGSVEGPTRTELKLNPIQQAVSDVTLGPIILVFDVIAEDDDGKVLIDITAAFSGDLGGNLSAQSVVSSATFMPLGVDPARSYVDRAQSFQDNLSVRSHLTFFDGNGTAMSLVIGHSIVVLTDRPAEGRGFDRRVGYFATSFVEFGGQQAVAERSLILRHPLERPEGAGEGLTDPVEPIIYYIGPGVPDRWRPFIKEGVELWQEALQAAGFSNAIIARDAPTEDENPDWSPEDARFNVIRWLPQEFPNAM